MKLTLKSFSLYDVDSPNEPTKIGAELDVNFDRSHGQIGGRIGLTFPHEGAESLTFKEVEKLATEKVLAAL
ncbi:hypothetical protein LZ838_09525 [Pseudomonas sp. AA27]|uniref:hypothetical protein n=1 Tax=Pseudomonas sp. AA27 TaxID=2908652 RepID=UPI001F3DC385|nr:hypothetical protein [Pseudomonas sp. AA27]MCF1487601.1 hypothetical protein [Pseudomonas sp. AA27]